MDLKYPVSVPDLPSTATRTASSAADVSAAAISARVRSRSAANSSAIAIRFAFLLEPTKKSLLPSRLGPLAAYQESKDGRRLSRYHLGWQRTRAPIGWRCGVARLFALYDGSTRHPYWSPRPWAFAFGNAARKGIRRTQRVGLSQPVKPFSGDRDARPLSSSSHVTSQYSALRSGATAELSRARQTGSGPRAREGRREAGSGELRRGPASRQRGAAPYRKRYLTVRRPQARQLEKPKAFHTPGCRSRTREPPPMEPQSFTVAYTV